MKIAIICSNAVSINKNSKRGTEIFDYILINSLVNAVGKDVNITAFVSGDSDLPVETQSVDKISSSQDKSILKKGKHIIFELALISKAFLMQDEFDLYHVNLGDGDIVLPFAPFVKKPILITLHYTQDADYINRYFSLFSNLKNVHFVSISNAQRKFFPKLNYASTIHHGVDTDQFTFSQSGGEKMMWAGRGVPDKGLKTIFEIVNRLGREVRLFPLRKDEYTHWLNELISEQKDLISSRKVSLEFDKDRKDLVADYQTSKLFLFPIQWEEPFGLVLLESLACGTPVVAYARGSVSEIIKDGETGFIINPTDNDIRGDWIIKKAGFEGLCEAVERIYSMPEEQYLKMRNDCRFHVEKYFTAEKMAKHYLDTYKSLL